MREILADYWARTNHHCHNRHMRQPLCYWCQYIYSNVRSWLEVVIYSDVFVLCVRMDNTVLCILKVKCKYWLTLALPFILLYIYSTLILVNSTDTAEVGSNIKTSLIKCAYLTGQSNWIVPLYCTGICLIYQTRNQYILQIYCMASTWYCIRTKNRLFWWSRTPVVTSPLNDTCCPSHLFKYIIVCG